MAEVLGTDTSPVGVAWWQVGVGLGDSPAGLFVHLRDPEAAAGDRQPQSTARGKVSVRLRRIGEGAGARVGGGNQCRLGGGARCS